jgi:pyridoxal phosphate-dependent aminotransferase EpsN
MDPGLLAEELDEALKAGRRPAAVVVVDLYGQCADMDPIADLCRRHGIPLIEDAAEALGATYRGKPAGTLGDVGIFSFNGNKIITTSGGGMIVSSRRDIVDKARFLATQARDPAPHYQHSHIGYNYRLSNLLAAVGRGQLRALEERVAARRANNLEYRRAFREVQGLDFMPDAPYGTPTAWLTCVTVAAESFGASRDQIRQYLEGHNIESRPVWKPMHLQPIFAGCSVRGGKVAEDLFARGLCLPSGSSLTPEQRARVVERVLDVPRHVGGGLGSASDSGR